MDAADNKRIVREFMQRLAGDAPDWDVVADDVQWWMQGIATVDKAGIIATSERVRGLIAEGEMILDHLTAEENRVAVEAHGQMKMTDGRVFANTYHFLFFVENGRITAVREHFDTAYARDFFGAGAQAALATPEGGGSPS